MTGFAEATADMPLTALTLGALEDFGYAVNFLATDPFPVSAAALRGASPLARAATTGSPIDEVLSPIGEVTPAGWVRWASAGARFVPRR